MSACIFCDIVAGRAPAALVYHDGGITAFLDVRPLFKGHVLVVPDGHAETLVDIDPATLMALFAVVQRLSGAVVRGLGAEGSFVAVNNRVSQSVPHLHVHVVPRAKGDGLRGFFWPRTKYADAAEQEHYRARITAALGG
ncbi:MAG TPA: HIT family protein [Polyangia bacterium]|jgi:histidine triad (HIT) family protein|nr:HIT family protein [Polyangia bacterium]